MLTGCPPLIYVPETSLGTVPSDFWTTRPVPCPYEEIMHMRVEAWNEPAALEPLLRLVSSPRADAVIDFRLTTDIARPEPSLCGSEAACDEVTGLAVLVIVEGLAVDWLCPDGQPVPNESD